jgi:hypothetical protein
MTGGTDKYRVVWFALLNPQTSKVRLWNLHPSSIGPSFDVNDDI